MSCQRVNYTRSGPKVPSATSSSTHNDTIYIHDRSERESPIKIPWCFFIFFKPLFMNIFTLIASWAFFIYVVKWRVFFVLLCIDCARVLSILWSTYFIYNIDTQEILFFLLFFAAAPFFPSRRSKGFSAKKKFVFIYSVRTRLLTISQCTLYFFLLSLKFQ